MFRPFSADPQSVVQLIISIYIYCIYIYLYYNYGAAGRPAVQELLRMKMVDLASLFCKHDVA